MLPPPPQPPFSPSTRRLRTHGPSTHTTAHCKQRDGGATRPPFSIHDSNAIRPHAHTKDTVICNKLCGKTTRPLHCIPHKHRYTRRDNDIDRPNSSTASILTAQLSLRDWKMAPPKTSPKDTPTGRPTYSTADRYYRIWQINNCPKASTLYSSSKRHRTLESTSHHTRPAQHNAQQKHPTPIPINTTYRPPSSTPPPHTHPLIPTRKPPPPPN